VSRDVSYLENAEILRQRSVAVNSVSTKQHILLCMTVLMVDDDCCGVVVGVVSPHYCSTSQHRWMDVPKRYPIYHPSGQTSVHVAVTVSNHQICISYCIEGQTSTTVLYRN
jgi:hypothetical protein